jgi:galactose mutarotase-like enzyme
LSTGTLELRAGPAQARVALQGATYEGGGARIRIAWDNLPHLALWSKPGTPFVCIEHWTGHSDSDGFTGKIFDKPATPVLPPGGSRASSIRYNVEGQGHG